MPQKTNLNINPYYDDFNVEKNFYKVLFKPGFPVQARELTTLQSILQNQIESFGSHIFKEGSMVIPGSITYDNTYFSVKINSEHLGIDVSLYTEQLVGKTIIGQNSGNIAIVKNYSIPPEDGVEDITLYVNYLSSGDDFEITQFEDGEIIITDDNVTYGNTTIPSGNTIATVLDNDATSIGSAVGLDNGVYFIRGTFVNVYKSQLILDPYSDQTSYRVGLSIFEEIVTSDEDNSLNDNARGFSNFAAPGADRFKITTTLSKKDLDDFDDKNFVELIRIERGEVKKLQDKSVYSIIKDYLAERTYDESGDYAVSRFDLDVLNSLNDGISNEGIYLSNERTSQGNVPSDDLMCVKVSSGKAYVRGFDVNFPGSTIIDVDKPRDTKNISASLVPFEMGNLLRVNNVSGTPFVGIGTGSNVVEFYNRRKNSTTSGTGNLIGKARIYSFNLTDASYSDQTTEWDLYLYDVQTYTILTLNSALDATVCPPSSYIRGVSSGASGYVVNTTISGSISLSQVSGSFIEGEQILINESLLNSRSINSVRSFTTEDIKSIYQDSTSLSSELKADFVADAVLYRRIPRGFSIVDRLTIDNTGIATCPGRSFAGIKTDTIIRYQKSDLSVETFNRIVSVAPDGNSIVLESVPDVVGICSGGLPTETEIVSFSLGIPEIRNQDKSSLYTELNSKNISSVDLSSANLIIYTQLRELSTNSEGTLIVDISTLGLTDVFFESFDAERYSIFYSDGSIEQLTSDQVIISNNGTLLTIGGLLTNQSSNVTLNLTVRKTLVTNKSKIFTRSEKLIVDKTVSDQSTNITGLSTSQFYGLRVEDPEISLNVSDVVNVRAVYESLTTSSPVLDRLTFVSGLSLDINAIVGEKIVGSKNGAIAQLVTKVSSTEVEFVYLNSKKFEVGETVTFEESQITSNIQLISIGSYLDITSRYALDKGQKNQYYDYSKIVRSRDSSAPSRQLLVIFDYYEIPVNDFGDMITVNSYDNERFGQDIPILEGGLRSSDTLDFRPRVARFTSTNSSPFDFDSKQFLPSIFDYVVSPNESSLVSYSYYLPRIDKLVLNKFGEFSLIKGISADDPKVPLNVEEAMEVATIILPAYLYDPKEAKITLEDNRRYTMRDIGKLEDRLENLEIVSSLSLLELDTKTLQIQDADGLSRFKTGFFVDDFKDTNLFDDSNSDLRCDVDAEKREMLAPVDFWSLKFELALRPDINTETADFSENLPLSDSNVRKTGDLITLNYREKGWLEQPLATNVENVNPFNVVEYAGGILLNPSADNWTRNIYIENRRTVFATTQTTTVTTTRVRTGPWWWWWWRRPASRTTTTTTTTSGSPIGEYDYVESVRVTTEPDPYMRSRNVEFRAGALKPQTRHYPYFDEISGIDIIPKLIEITMVSGTFEVGEDIAGLVDDDQIFSARTARPDHKGGSFRNPTVTYNLNPYDRNLTLPTSYSASSTVLNIDTFSLAEESLTKYGGHIQVGMKIVGSSSGAVATVSNIRLITDTFGDLIGSFFLRDPNEDPPPSIRVKTGQKIFKLTAEPPGSQSLPGSTTFASEGQAAYFASGLIQTQVTNIVEVRNPPPPPPPPRRRRGGKDPLAQSFTVDETGAFLTSVDVYFASKDPNEKLYVELRTVELGTPTNQLVQDYSRIVLEPGQIETSSDASVPTRVTFPSPVYLQPRTEYALVFLAPTSDLYEMWVGTMGQKTVGTQNLPNPENVVMTKQYTGGSLFKSQNGTIWTASQFQDLKFKLYKAEFTSTSGEIVFYNPPLRVEEGTIHPLAENSITTFPRKLRVGITTTTTMNSILTVGRKISEGSTGPTGPIGFIENTGGPIASISISNSGIGYSQGSYTNVPLYSITGSGTGAVGTITINSSGNVSSVSITQFGSGYSNGDVVGITTSNVIKGRDARISVTSTNGIDTLYLTNVQGEEFTSNQSLIYFEGNSPISVASTTIIGNSSLIDPIYSGNVFEVNHINHAMHAVNNTLQIKNIFPDTTPIALTAPLNIGDTSISIASTIGFDNFEGITTSRGFIKVQDEIIFYDSIGVGNVLGISTRGVDGTFITNHNTGSIAYKYELNGVSLRKINTIHNMASVQNSGLQILKTFDRYYLSYNRDPERSFGNSQLSFADEKFAGGILGSRNAPAASQNHQFTNITPQFNVITPGSTSTVSAQIRTVSGTSAGGNEISFLDQGFQPIQLNKANFFNTPRLICSEVNELARLSALPKNKSLTVKIRMSSEDPNLSPVLDLQTAYMVIGRNKINNPIRNYAFDGRVNLVNGDPHSAIYISQKVDLKQPATSLKALIGSYNPSQSDFRVLYRLFKPNSSEIDPSFELFPGYNNLRDTNGDGFGDVVIDPSANNGRPDALVRSSRDNEFLEYQFTAENLDQFSAFQIKIVMSSTNESFAPRFKDIRVIALA
jgi:hypothetical protein